MRRARAAATRPAARVPAWASSRSPAMLTATPMPGTRRLALHARDESFELRAQRLHAESLVRLLNVPCRERCTRSRAEARRRRRFRPTLHRIATLHGARQRVYDRHSARKSAMEPQQPLFRAAAVAARKHDGLGAIVLVRPISFAFLAAFAAAVAGGVGGARVLRELHGARDAARAASFRSAASSTSRAAQAGTIVEKRVGEGERVAAGDTLLVLSSERLTRSGAALETAIGAELESRRASLARADRQHAPARGDGARRVARAPRGARAPRPRVSPRRWRRSAAARVGRASRATLRGRARARVLVRGAVGAARGGAARAAKRSRNPRARERRIGASRSRARRAPRDAAAAIRERRSPSSSARSRAASVEIVENEARRATIVTAPQPGTVTGLAADARPVRAGSAPCSRASCRTSPTLVAELFAPSRAVGFVADGDEVRLRYAAFPYQKFGHARGTVVAVSATTVAGDARARRRAPVSRRRGARVADRDGVRRAARACCRAWPSRPTCCSSGGGSTSGCSSRCTRSRAASVEARRRGGRYGEPRLCLPRL